MAIILGIDPGLGTCGYGLIRSEDNDLEIVDFGVIVTQSGKTTAARLNTLGDDLLQLCKGKDIDLVCTKSRFLRNPIPMPPSSNMP